VDPTAVVGVEVEITALLATIIQINGKECRVFLERVP
jgi:hypothetical protein